ncbi:MAG TPA: CvpA family protein [Burkholderiales bacterium]|nr:CvpA family protein [Burkholderiales bacterium]
MTAIDYAVLAIVIVSVLLGVMRGFVRETLSLAAWFAAFWSANHFSPMLSGMLPQGISGAPLRILVAFAAIFLVTLIVLALLTKLLSGMVKKAGLGWMDGMLGFMFGFARGALIVLVLVLLSGLTSFPESATWQHAQFRGMLETGAVVAGSWLPESMSRHIRFGGRRLNYK